MSPWLLACWNSEAGALEGVYRVMSGFTDAFYVENTKKYRGYLGTQPDDPTNACPEDGGGKTSTPGCLLLPCSAQNVDAWTEASESWFRAAEVWEMAAKDMTLSPDQACARGFAHPTCGLSLHSPRFVRKRPDKGIRNAFTARELASLFVSPLATLAFELCVLGDTGLKTGWVRCRLIFC